MRWELNSKSKSRRPHPIPYNVADRIVQARCQGDILADILAVGSVLGREEWCCAGRSRAIKAAEGIVVAKEQVAFVISRRAESVVAGRRRAEETLVNQSEVIGVHCHAAVGAAGPPDVVWLGAISVGVDHGQAALAIVVRVEGQIGEGGIQGLETLGDIVRRGENAGTPDVSELAGHVLIVVDVEAGWAADGIGHARAARDKSDGGSGSAGRRGGRGDRLRDCRRGGHIYRTR